MHRTTIMLPPELKARAEERASKLGISLGRLIREALTAILARETALREDDPLFGNHPVFDGVDDLAERHDDYLYGPEE